MSFRSRVPAAVPSVSHGSVPCVPSFGLEQHRTPRHSQGDRVRVSCPGRDVRDEPGPGRRAVALPQLEPVDAVERREVDRAARVQHQGHTESAPPSEP